VFLQSDTQVMFLYLQEMPQLDLGMYYKKLKNHFCLDIISYCVFLYERFTLHYNICKWSNHSHRAVTIKLLESSFVSWHNKLVCFHYQPLNNALIFARRAVKDCGKQNKGFNVLNYTWHNKVGCFSLSATHAMVICN